MAKRVPDYFELAKQLSAQVVRWEHATFARNHLEPANCERNGWKPGRVLAKLSKQAWASYRFADDGKLLIAREGQHEQLYVWGKDEVLTLMFDRSEIVWARKQRWGAKDLAKAAAIVGRTKFTFQRGRLARVEHTWPRKTAIVERYVYDAAGRVASVHVSKPKHTDELEYDATGQVVRVVYRYPSGQRTETFRRAPAADQLPLLLPKIQAALLAQIPRVLARTKIKQPVYSLAISTCLEEAPHLLPPRLTLGLVTDRDARIAKGGEYVRDDLWLPESLPLHDDARLRLSDRALLKLCDRANVAREDDEPIMVMLRKLAAQLQRRGLADVLTCPPELVVYAVDVGGEDPERAVRRAAPKPIAKRLKKLGLL
jgi:hypothetical protein